MQLEDFREAWQNQQPENEMLNVRAIVEKHVRRRDFTSWMLLGFCALAVASAIHHFVISYLERNEGLWVALTRCSLFLILAVIQWFVWRSFRRENERRQRCGNDQRACLTQMVRDLDKEIGELNPIRLAVPFLLVVGFVSLNKFIDFWIGADSLVECVVITLAAAALSLFLVTLAWHRQQQFVIPRRNRLQEALESLGNES